MNLLPEKNKYELRMEYYKRLAIVGITSCAALILLGLVPVLVAYVTTSYEIIFLKHEIAAIQRVNQLSDVDGKVEIIKNLKNKLSILSQVSVYGIKGNVHERFLGLVDTAKVGIHITSLSYGPTIVKKGANKTVNYVINISGTADSRDILLKFVKKLEADKTFSAVDLPISNLVESKNPAFSIVLTLSKK